MIGDVGQNRFEEVDIETEDSLRKANFGWDRYEGFKGRTPATRRTGQRRASTTSPSSSTTTRTARP